jgi:hypothetical protein
MRCSRSPLLTIASTGLILFGVSLPADQLERTTLSAWDAQEGDRFGHAVALSEKWVIVGAPFDNLTATHSGSVAAFQRNDRGANQVDILAPADGLKNQFFGLSVAISGEVCVVGAPWDDDRGRHSGSAYVFRWDGKYWHQEAKLLAHDGAADDRFGYSVEIEGDRIAVGARWDDDQGTNSGSVYLFERTDGNWKRSIKLIPEGGGEADEFGISLSFSGDRLAVGAFGDSHKGEQTGAVYVFSRRGYRWALESLLTANDAAEGDGFGSAIDLEGETLVIGAPWKSIGDEPNGAVYVFFQSEEAWVQKTRLVPTGGTRGQHFGWSVAISGDRVLVGAPFGGEAPDRTGIAFLYEDRNGEHVLLGELPGETRSGAEFGFAVDLDGKALAVGARGMDAGQISLYSVH